jgi:hypothetical protein
VASTSPRASSRKGALHRMAAKCLRAGDSTLRPAHCPTFPLVTFMTTFCMLWTAQNRCRVFAGIGSILMGGDKMAIAWQPTVGGCVEITLFRGLSNSTMGTPRCRVLACNPMYYLIIHLFYYKTPW